MLVPEHVPKVKVSWPPCVNGSLSPQPQALCGHYGQQRRQWLPSPPGQPPLHHSCAHPSPPRCCRCSLTQDFYQKECWAHHPPPYADFIAWKQEERAEQEAERKKLVHV